DKRPIATAADVFAALGMDDLDDEERWLTLDPLFAVLEWLAPTWTAILASQRFRSEQRVGTYREPMRCKECNAQADEHARGWRALIAFDPRDPDDEPVTVTYCPDCAWREFGPPRPKGRELID